MESRNRTPPRRPCRTVRPGYPRAWRVLAVLGMLTAPLALAACTDEAAPVATDTISTEAFIEAMVALRTSPLVGTSGFLPSGEPERILGERGLTPDDLRTFADVHGGNVPMMTEVWTQVEARVAEARSDSTTAPGS